MTLQSVYLRELAVISTDAYIMCSIELQRHVHIVDDWFYNCLFGQVTTASLHLDDFSIDRPIDLHHEYYSIQNTLDIICPCVTGMNQSDSNVS